MTNATLPKAGRHCQKQVTLIISFDGRTSLRAKVAGSRANALRFLVLYESRFCESAEPCRFIPRRASTAVRNGVATRIQELLEHLYLASERANRKIGLKCPYRSAGRRANSGSAFKRRFHERDSCRIGVKGCEHIKNGLDLCSRQAGG